MRRSAVALLVLCMLAATLAGCGTKSTVGVGTSDMAADQTVRYNLAVEPASLDPALADGNPELETVLQLFDGLTRYDKNNVPQPAIATSWDVSADKMTYTFHRIASYRNHRERVSHCIIKNHREIVECVTAPRHNQPRHFPRSRACQLT